MTTHSRCRRREQREGPDRSEPRILSWCISIIWREYAHVNIFRSVAAPDWSDRDFRAGESLTFVSVVGPGRSQPQPQQHS